MLPQADLVVRLLRWMVGALFVVAAIAKVTGAPPGTILDDWSARWPLLRPGGIIGELVLAFGCSVELHRELLGRWR
jgi:hypothetical protein